MNAEHDDRFREQAGAYALGALDAEERAALEAHLACGCEACVAEVAAAGAAVAALAQGERPSDPPAPDLRAQMLDLTEAPALPIDFAAYRWREAAPGVRFCVLKEDPARGLRACLVWAQPGARHPRHRHLGDENILVLQGALRDPRGVYGPGQICRSRPGSVHEEEAMPGADCICYVTYYGGLELVEP